MLAWIQQGSDEVELLAQRSIAMQQSEMSVKQSEAREG